MHAICISTIFTLSEHLVSCIYYVILQIPQKYFSVRDNHSNSFFVCLLNFQNMRRYALTDMLYSWYQSSFHRSSLLRLAEDLCSRFVRASYSIIYCNYSSPAEVTTYCYCSQIKEILCFTYIYSYYTCSDYIYVMECKGLSLWTSPKIYANYWLFAVLWCEHGLMLLPMLYTSLILGSYLSTQVTLQQPCSLQ